MENLSNNGVNDGKAEAYPARSERYMQYRAKLIKAGFSEAEYSHCRGHFFRRQTEKTAFIINLYDEEYGVSVMYGFTSTTYLAGDEDWLKNNGAYKDDCKIRNILFIWDDGSELSANERITDFYEEYKNYEKDDILRLKKERQKEFLDSFTRALKPFGFKKKNTKWTKELPDGMALTFEAQKSAFSDEYYFNVIVHDRSNFWAQRSNERVVRHNSDIYNWQLMNDEQIKSLIQCVLDDHILPKV